jgi:tetratricopeptide (TPR) repeat protein
LFPRLVVTIVVVAAVAALAFVQIGSAAIYRGDDALGERIYRTIDRITPASYVNDTLAFAAMRRGDAAAAEQYALQMPAGPRRDEWLAQAARAQGEHVLAREYFFAAADVDALQREIAGVARTNVDDALVQEALLRDRLIALGTHPDALADSYLQSANYEARLRRYGAAAGDSERAVALAPRNVGYLLTAGYNELFAGNRARAEQLFAHSLAVNPACRDCAIGLARARGAQP